MENKYINKSFIKKLLTTSKKKSPIVYSSPGKLLYGKKISNKKSLTSREKQSIFFFF